MISSYFSSALDLKLYLVCMLHFVAIGRSIRSHKTHRSYGTLVLDHLAADRAGLAAGQVAVIAVLQVDAHLLRCVFISKI